MSWIATKFLAAKQRPRGGVGIALLLWAGGVVGCGTIDAERGTCEWLEGANCWKETVIAAAECLDQNSIPALSADRLECEYFDGSKTVFASPVGDPTSPEHMWEFELVRDGEVCMSHRDLGPFLQEGTGFVVTSSRGTLIVDFERDKLVLTCPDGSRFKWSVRKWNTCSEEHRPSVTFGSDADLGFGFLRYRGAPSTSGVVMACTDQ